MAKNPLNKQNYPDILPQHFQVIVTAVPLNAESEWSSVDLPFEAIRLCAGILKLEVAQPLKVQVFSGLNRGAGHRATWLARLGQ